MLPFNIYLYYVKLTHKFEWMYGTHDIYVLNFLKTQTFQLYVRKIHNNKDITIKI